MLNPEVEKFESIYNDPKNYNDDGTICEEAISQIKQINFLSFDINDIQILQKADKLPVRLVVPIYRAWIHQQEKTLSQIRGHVLATPMISKDRLIRFLNVLGNPSKPCDLVVENILLKMSQGGGIHDRKPINLIDPNPEKSILTFGQSTLPGSIKYETIQYLFDPNVDSYNAENPDNPHYFSTDSLSESFLIIGLPSYMKVNLKSYKLKAPPYLPHQKAQGGPQSWSIYGSNNWTPSTQERKEDNWKKLDIQIENTDLAEPSAEHVFMVDQSNNFYRFFKIKNDGKNHQENFALSLSGFDISGNVVIRK